MYQRVPKAPPLFPGDRRVNQAQAHHVRTVWSSYDQRSQIRVDRRRRHGWTRLLFCPPGRLAKLAWRSLRNGVEDLIGLTA